MHTQHAQPQPTSLVMGAGEMLEEMEDVNVLAPLVRCSKLPFRHLVSMYETHITHTPMMLAPEFSRAQTARISDFKTSSKERGSFWMRRRRRRSDLLSNDLDEAQEYRSGSESSNQNGNQHVRENLHLYDESAPRRPDPTTRPSKDHELVRGLLIAQFASNNGASLADACEIISVKPTIGSSESEVGSGEFIGRPKRTSQPQENDESRRLVDGVDLNCGCPQPWAYSEGIGSALLRKPHIVADMVRQVNERMGSDFGISVKIRVDDDLKLTERLVQTAVHCDITHLTIHGRTRHQLSTEPVSLSSIKFAVDCAKGRVPCVGNGDIWDLRDAEEMRRETGVKGVMAARGLLANPALFAGYISTPKTAVEDFVDLSTAYGLPYSLFQRHISYMLENTMTRHDRLYLNSIASYAGVTDWLQDKGLAFGVAR